MVQIVCRNVEKHSVKMMEELHRMKQEKDQCDFIIQVGDDVYYTHRNVLSAGCAYFKAMLRHDTKESSEGKVVLKEVDSQCVKNCIDFIYSGKFEIPDEKMNDLLHVAIMMQLDDMKQALSDVLEESVDIKNSKWEKMNDTICDHGISPRSVSLSGSIFVVGGSYPKATSDVEMFASPVNQWIQLEDKPFPIKFTSLVSLNDSIYCIGGEGPGLFPLSSYCRFTPSSSEWVDLEPMRYPVSDSGVVAVDQKILVIGGWTKGIKVNSVECYDVTSAQWTSLSSMNGCHGGVSAYQHDKWIFAVSDYESFYPIEKYDTSRDKWTVVKPKGDQCIPIDASKFVKR